MNVTSFPTFSTELSQCLEKSSNRIVREAEPSIGKFFEFADCLPLALNWERITPELLAVKLNGKNVSVGRVNYIYWSDMIQNYVLFSQATIWRLRDTISAAVHSANAGNITASSILSRAAVELAANYSQSIEPFSRACIVLAKDMACDLSEKILTDSEQENECIRALFASRMPGVPEERKAKNIVTVIEKIAKKTNSDYIVDLYGRLCEYAHPNVWGTARYEDGVKKIDAVGIATIAFSRDAKGVGYAYCLSASAEGLGWASHVAVYYGTGFDKARQAAQIRLDKLV